MEIWYCVYTKPKQEDHVCRRLKDLPGMEVFNPKLKVTKTLRSRSIEVVEELFPSYIFLRFGAPSYFHMIQYTRGVKRFVGSSLGAPYAVDDVIIRHIKSRMIDGLVHTNAPQLTKGQEVLIKGGPFNGLTGLFLNETKPSERVMILLSMLGSDLKVEIGREQVIPALL